jgi:hypothetical protein
VSSRVELVLYVFKHGRTPEGLAQRFKTD